ncbi:galectin-4-like [Haliotis rubra]|uniref:galectin-4-like n=1 Tax=Haliotis rubra TaxID=36100 RepID=UPI001EE56EBB|nr:galectin-4-like [Haliotis rubra]
MLLYNPTSKRCRLYKSFVNTGGTEDTGWQYYAAECSHVRLENAVSLSVVNQTVDVACRSGFTYLLSPPLPCPLGTGVLDIGRCAQTLWTDQVTPFVTDLPAPLSTGAEIRVRGSGDGGSSTGILLQGTEAGNTVFLLAIRWSRLDAIFNTESSGSWGSEIGPSGFIFSPNVVFDALVRITTTKFMIFINGSNFYEAPIRISVQKAAILRVSFSRIDSVEVKYP